MEGMENNPNGCLFYHPLYSFFGLYNHHDAWFDLLFSVIWTGRWIFICIWQSDLQVHPYPFH